MNECALCGCTRRRIHIYAIHTDLVLLSVIAIRCLLAILLSMFLSVWCFVAWRLLLMGIQDRR